MTIIVVILIIGIAGFFIYRNNKARADALKAEVIQTARDEAAKASAAVKKL